MGKYKHGLACLRKDASYRTAQPLYNLWLAVKNRCHNSRTPAYPSYGGRGIVVCEEWRHNPAAFISWCQENDWESGKVIDRINNDGPYAPWNCRLTTRKVNSRNTRRNRVVSAFGETKTLAEWAEDQRATVGYAAIWSRLMLKGWTPEEAIARPSRYK